MFKFLKNGTFYFKKNAYASYFDQRAPPSTNHILKRTIGLIDDGIN